MAFTQTNLLEKAKLMAFAGNVDISTVNNLTSVKNIFPFAVGLTRTIGKGYVEVTVTSFAINESNMSPLFVMSANGEKSIDIGILNNVYSFCIFNRCMQISSQNKITVTSGASTIATLHSMEYAFFVNDTLVESSIRPFGFSNCELSVKETKGDELCLSWAHVGYVQDKNVEVTIPSFGFTTNMITDYVEKVIYGDAATLIYNIKNNYIYIAQMIDDVFYKNTIAELLQDIRIWMIKNDGKLDIEQLAQANQHSLTTFSFKKSVGINDNKTLRLITNSTIPKP